MVPGLWPTLLMTRGNPIRDGVLFSSSWIPDGPGYRCDVDVQFAGGTAPFTYQWVDEGGGITFVSPTAKATVAKGSSAAASPVFCRVTDALGEIVEIQGAIGA